jgi:RHH-type proline utilization regulon transcriptional repressor/proline dehydrogenase/delta 1-pyrroline-5-carboxylate dehydrogenase
MQAAGLCVTRLGRDESGGLGTFVRPTLIELDTIDRLQREVFGPVLHVLRYRREQLGAVLDAINATGYGLTFGVHSRIDETIADLSERIHAGNVYVNRNLIGAVVGVQPFGGMGRSGTGPKAGGPLYLHRLVQPLPQANSALPANLAAAAAECSKITPEPASLAALRDLLAAVQNHTMNLDDEDTTRAQAACEHYLAHSPISSVYTLPGPTGESNRYRLLPRSGGVWCTPQTALGLVHHIAATLATGNLALIEAPSPDSPLATFLDALPPAVKAYVRSCPPTQRDTLPELSVVLFEGDADALARLQDQLAQRDGLILRIESLRPAQLADGAMMDLTALVHEQSLSVNTAAAGGNAQLMTLG